MASTWPAKNNYATGDVLTAANMNGVGDDLNDVYNFSGYAAGKNKIINGDFGIWQRGTSFTNPNGYTADRFYAVNDGTGATHVISQQTFTPGTAPVSGYEGTYFLRWNQSVAGSGATYNVLGQKIEDVRTYAGQTITVSFWAKADSARSMTLTIFQYFGTGGSTPVGATSSTINLSTSWARYTATLSIPSIAGKTIGTGSSLAIELTLGSLNATKTYDFWGLQVEAGSTASIFQTATGTKQGELAACQRYYWRSQSASTNNVYGFLTPYCGMGQSGTSIQFGINVPVPMRVAPTSVEYANLRVADGTGVIAVSSVALDSGNNSTCPAVVVTVASGATQYRMYNISANNSTAAYFALSSEL